MGRLKIVGLVSVGFQHNTSSVYPRTVVIQQGFKGLSHKFANSKNNAIRLPYVQAITIHPVCGIKLAVFTIKNGYLH